MCLTLALHPIGAIHMAKASTDYGAIPALA
jgi:hypothetical protein